MPVLARRTTVASIRGLPRHLPISMRFPAPGLVPLVLVGCAVTVAALGCAHLAVSPRWDRASLQQVTPASWSATEGLPSRAEIVAGQLVIHADFPLAEQHRIVRELESLRTDVSQQLGLPISDEPVHLYLFENKDRYDAFAARQFPGFPTRRAFFVETDTTLSVFAVWQDRIAEDLRHETTHGYVQDHYAEAWCWTHWLLCTTPQRQRLLQDYLADVRRDVQAAPLSARLRYAEGSTTDLSATLRAHLETLVPPDDR